MIKVWQASMLSCNIFIPHFLRVSLICSNRLLHPFYSYYNTMHSSKQSRVMQAPGDCQIRRQLSIINWHKNKVILISTKWKNKSQPKPLYYIL